MINFEFNIVNLLLVIFIAYISNLVVMWLIHFAFHHNILGIPLDKIHLNSHHSNQVLSDSKSYYLAILEHSIVVVLWSVYILLLCLISNRWIGLTIATEAVILASITYYLHVEYIKPKSWLNQYSWFRRDKQLHQIHHSYYGDQFSSSNNYSFGGITGHLTDRLFGTFESVKTKDINNIVS